MSVCRHVSGTSYCLQVIFTQDNIFPLSPSSWKSKELLKVTATKDFGPSSVLSNPSIPISIGLKKQEAMYYFIYPFSLSPKILAFTSLWTLINTQNNLSYKLLMLNMLYILNYICMYKMEMWSSTWEIFYHKSYLCSFETRVHWVCVLTEWGRRAKIYSKIIKNVSSQRP